MYQEMFFGGHKLSRIRAKISYIFIIPKFQTRHNIYGCLWSRLLEIKVKSIVIGWHLDKVLIGLIKRNIWAEISDNSYEKGINRGIYEDYTQLYLFSLTLLLLCSFLTQKTLKIIKTHNKWIIYTSRLIKALWRSKV